MGRDREKAPGGSHKPLAASPNPAKAPAERHLIGLPRRNPLFTGREGELADVHRVLRSGNAALTSGVAALHGMGGEGKTQTAVEYAYRYANEYARVFMVRAEREGEFTSGLAALAEPLGLREANLADTGAQTEAVMRWMEANPDWLMIVDNAERLDDLRKQLPEGGRVLVTTRERVRASFGTRVEVSHLDKNTGALLLLRCAGRITPNESLDAASEVWQEGARQVSELLGGLALAIHQAGSYIDEAGITPDAYIELYRERRQQLHPNRNDIDHDTVTVTFSLALEQVERIDTYGPAAGQLIRLCAFLAPDAIPDELFVVGYGALNEPLATTAADSARWLEVVKAATRYSLIRRDVDFHGFALHRLVAEVIRDEMSAEIRSRFIHEAIEVLNKVFPDPIYETWALCVRLLPHSLTLREMISTAPILIPSSARLLDHTASYLQHLARYSEAENLYRQGVEVRYEIEGDSSLDAASGLNNLGGLLNVTGRYDEAIPVLEKSILIRRNNLDTKNLPYFIALGNL